MTSSFTPDPNAEEPTGPDHAILVPLRGMPAGETMLQVSRQQTQAFGDALLLLHVLPASALDAEAITPVEATARAQLDALVADLRASGYQVDALVRVGSPAAVIVEEARMRRVRLIILGISNRPRLARVLLGSVADAVVRHAPCPVLLVRPPAPPGSGQPLLSLVPPDRLVPRPLGLRTVELSRIVGSATQAHDLAADFRRLHSAPEDEQRFRGIMAAMARGEEVPPVELYKLGFGYYVRDGHHRVAAARALGQTAIGAQVAELVPSDDADAERAFEARRAFERATGLTSAGAARAESYDRLSASIEEYRREQGLADIQDAARRWYDEVFRPLRRRVRELGLAGTNPGDRPADVIARVAERRAKEAERVGAAPNWDEAFEAERRLAHPGRQ